MQETKRLQTFATCRLCLSPEVVLLHAEAHMDNHHVNQFTLKVVNLQLSLPLETPRNPFLTLTQNRLNTKHDDDLQMVHQHRKNLTTPHKLRQFHQ